MDGLLGLMDWLFIQVTLGLRQMDWLFIPMDKGLRHRD